MSSKKPRPRVKRAEKPENFTHEHAGDGGKWEVQTLDSVWGIMPSGYEDEPPGVRLTIRHAGADEHDDHMIGLLVDDLDSLIDSLVEARAVLTKRHGLAPSRFKP